MSRDLTNLLTVPRYPMRDVARIVGTRTANIRNWFVGYERNGIFHPPVFGDCVLADQRQPELSFLDLSEAVVVASMRNHGLALQRIRNARDFVQQELGCEHPFAERQFAKLGGRIIHEFEMQNPDARQVATLAVDGSGNHPQPNWALPGFMQYAVSLFDYSDAEFPAWALRLFPRGRDRNLVADPRVRGGRVIVLGTSLPVYLVYERSRSGESYESIAADYQITVHDVENAIAFQTAA